MTVSSDSATLAAIISRRALGHAVSLGHDGMMVKSVANA
jgi:hypothetical protein